jgi:hypothetical protein
MASHELQPDERVLWEGRRFSLQGRRIKFPVSSRNVVTDRRIIHYRLGRMAPFHVSMGLLLRLLVKGKPVSLPLEGLRVYRGKYVKNNKILALRAADGTEVLLDRFEKTLDWLRNTLETNGISLSQTGEEEWEVRP